MSKESNHRRARLRKLLVERKRRMWNELRDEVFRKLGRDYSAQFDIPLDLEELSVVDLVEDLGLAVSDIRRREVEEVEQAIVRLDDGTYGTCGLCGSEIDEGRLKAAPCAERCLKCQSEAEAASGVGKPTL